TREPRQTVLPHLPPFASPLPPLTTRPPELPRKVMYPRQFTEPRHEPPVAIPLPAEPVVFEVQEGSLATATKPVVATPSTAYAVSTPTKVEVARRDLNIVRLLKSSGGLRDAIVLREILGPPRS